VGDGNRDDTDAIQQTLNLDLSEGGISVYIPKGVYKLTRMLRIYRRTRLMLHPDAVMLRCHNDSFLINGDFGAQYDGYEGHGDLIIEGGVWDGSGGIVMNLPTPNSESTKDKDGVQRGVSQSCRGVRIASNFIAGAAAYGGIACYGVAGTPVYDVSITDNFVYGAGTDKHAITVTWCENANVEGNIIEDARRGVYATNTKQGKMEGNKIAGIVVNGN
jgi:hypothetical protein